MNQLFAQVRPEAQSSDCFALSAVAKTQRTDKGMTKLFTIAVLVLSSASNGCKHVDETKIADKAACGAMIKSIEVNNRLLAATTDQIIDADRALRMADRWNRKQVTDAEDGRFSGAAHRAVMHAGSARAFCDAARQVHAGIESIARQVKEPAVHVDEHTLFRQCFSQFAVDDPDKPSRDQVAAKWKTEVIWYQTAESRYRDACKANFGVDDVSVDGFMLGAWPSLTSSSRAAPTTKYAGRRNSGSRCGLPGCRAI